MRADDINVLVGRMEGDGNIEIIETELPMNIGELSSNLSAPSTLYGAITNGARRLRKNGRPIFEPWNSCIIIEAADQIRSMTIYRKPTFTGQVWELDQIGFGGYPLGMPYVGEQTFVGADPLAIWRHIWDHLQGQPYGNLGVTLGSASSPVRIGDPPSPDDTGQDGPFRLNWWETTNLGGVIDTLTQSTPFDWRESFYWDGEQPRCHLEAAWPIIGQRRDEYRLVLGENLAEVPTLTESDFVSEVHVLGAGEGRERVRGFSAVSPGRIRRATVVDDKGITHNLEANAVARDELVAARGGVLIDSVVVYDHPNAPLEAIQLGDELPLYAETDWMEVDRYVRVIGKSESPQEHDRATLTLVGVSAL